MPMPTLHIAWILNTIEIRSKSLELKLQLSKGAKRAPITLVLGQCHVWVGKVI